MYSVVEGRPGGWEQRERWKRKIGQTHHAIQVTALTTSFSLMLGWIIFLDGPTYSGKIPVESQKKTRYST
jgi:hypothetical protein